MGADIELTQEDSVRQALLRSWLGLSDARAQALEKRSPPEVLAKLVKVERLLSDLLAAHA